MIESRLEFTSGDEPLEALLRVPDRVDFPEPVGTVVHAPGWMSRKDAKHYLVYHESLVSAGLAVLIFDYRGVRRSPSGGRISLFDHLFDTLAAVAAVSGTGHVPPARVGVLGTGGSGGALALYAAAVDETIACAAAISPFADGRDWLRRMRSEEEWTSYLARIRANRRRMAGGSEDEPVDPLSDVVTRSPVRAAISFKSDIVDELPTRVGLSVADTIIAINPVDLIHRIAPRPIHLFAAASDVPVPYDHATALYRRAGPPKTLWTLEQTDGYRLHQTHGELMARRLAGWFADALGVGRGNVDDLPPTPLVRVSEERE